MTESFVVGAFDNLKSRQLRLLQEAAKCGSVHVLLWTDESILDRDGKAPHFPQAERQYYLDAIRYVDRVTLCRCTTDGSGFPDHFITPGATWVIDQAGDHPDQAAWCRDHRLQYQVVAEGLLATFPDDTPYKLDAPSARKKVVVTGCFDWFHTGHVRFFEEVSEFGDLYVVVGHDANIRLLKGAGHPMFPAEERRYIAGSIRHVTHALVASGDGWLDAEPEIQRIRPDLYAVNEDGDRPEKRQYCEANGIEYRVLQRTPREGLPRRASTDLRGF